MIFQVALGPLLLLGAMMLVTCFPNGSDTAIESGEPTPTASASVARANVSSPHPGKPAFKDLERGWTRLPSPPEARSSTAAAWTGDSLITWGGYVYSGFSDESAQSGGFIFDARSREWDWISPSPLDVRTVPASAWTGDELLIWGGARSADLATGFHDDGAAYDPMTNTWRALPQAPIGARAPLSAWTGREFIVWGTVSRINPRPRDGAAYNPMTDTWREIATAPIELTDATAVWTGKEMIVFGAALHGGNKPENETAIGAAYNPTTDRWRRIPDSDLSPQASTAAWDGRNVIAWDYENNTAAYDPATNRWRTLPDVPLDNYECSPDSVSIRRYVFGNYCGLMAVYDPSDNRWHEVSRMKFAGWGFTVAAADHAVLLIGRNVDTEKEAMYAYRPPSW